MIVVASGDSNTWGVEVIPPRFSWDTNVVISPTPSEEDLREIDIYRRDHVWCQRLAEMISPKHGTSVNLAAQGASNQRICREALKYAGTHLREIKRNPKAFLFACGWSTFDRFEIFDEERGEWDRYGVNYGPEKKIREFYYSRMHSYEAAVYDAWSNLLTFQGQMERLGVHHVSFSCYEDMSSDACPRELVGLVDWDKVMPRTMYWDLESNGFVPGPGQHYGVDGHEFMAGQIKEFIRA